MKVSPALCVCLTLSCIWLWSARCCSICALRVAVYPQSGQTMWPPSLSWQYLMWSLKEAPRWYILWQNGQACWVLPASGVQREVTLFTMDIFLHSYIYPVTGDSSLSQHALSKIQGTSRTCHTHIGTHVKHPFWHSHTSLPLATVNYIHKETMVEGLHLR